MFFKMLKNDLRQKKALNFVLFLFITIAAMLVFVSSVQLHEYITGNERNRDACKMSDMLIFSDSQGSTQEDSRKNCKDNLDKNSHVKSYYQREMKRAQIGQIDFESSREKIRQGVAQHAGFGCRPEEDLPVDQGIQQFNG